MKHFSAIPLAFLAVGFVHAQTVAPAKAKPKLLTIGSIAPALNVGGWAKGTPVTQFDPNKLYVVEFWATWCGPCKESIPHLTMLAKKYAGKVTFTGVSVWEQDEAAKGTPYSVMVSKVKSFVKQEGNNMDYNVAYDNSYDTSPTNLAHTWMMAAAQGGIPTAFVIQKDHIIWIGHPMTLEKPLAEITTGKYDETAFKKSFTKSQEVAAIEMKIQPAMQSQNYASAIALCVNAEKKHPEIANQIQPDHYAAIYLSKDQTAASAYLNANAPSNPAIYLVATQLELDYGRTKDEKMDAVKNALAYSNSKGADPYESKFYLASAYQSAGDTKDALATVNNAISMAKADKSSMGAEVLPTFEHLKASISPPTVAKTTGNSSKKN